MPAIEKELKIKDGFSNPLDRYVSKLKRVDAALFKNYESTQRLEAEAEQVSEKIAALQEQKARADYGGPTTVAWKNWMKSGNEQVLESLISQSDSLAARLYDLDKRATSLLETHDRLVDEKAEKRRKRIDSLVSFAKKSVSGLFHRTKDEVDDLGKTTGIDSLTKRLMRMALTLVSARRLLTYLRNAIGRAPDAIAKPFTKLKETISNGFAGWMVSLLRGLTNGLTALNAAFKSSSGQRFARGMETLFRALGTVLGFVIEKLTVVVTWLGDHFQQIAMGVGIIVGLLAVKFALMAGAIMLAHWPLVLIAGAVIGLVGYLESLGMTTEQVFNYIGQGVGWLYSLVYNIVADVWNLIASFAEDFATLWRHPFKLVAKMAVDLFDTIVGIVETAAKAIDALLGTNSAKTITGFRNSIQSWADDTFGESVITLKRMDKLDPRQAMDTFGSWAGGLGASLSNASLERQKAQSLKSIASDTKSIKNAVTDEDLKNMIEVASRAFVSQVNLTSQTPVITINGANTGNTEEDRRRLGEAIKYILMEQVAAGSTSSPYVYSGR